MTNVNIKMQMISMALVCAFAALAPFGQAQGVMNYQDFSMGGFAMDQLAKAYQEFQQVKVMCDDLGIGHLCCRF